MVDTQAMHCLQLLRGRLQSGTTTFPKDIWWNRVLTDGGAAHGRRPLARILTWSMYNVTVACQHCENPACVKVCPVGATYKDPETGVVRQDYDKCIGCRMCMARLPLHGRALASTGKSPSTTWTTPWASKDVPVHQKHVVEKCTFCYHRTSRRAKSRPACDLCVGARPSSGAILTIPIPRCRSSLRDRDVQAALAEDRGTEAVRVLPRLAEGSETMSEYMQGELLAGDDLDLGVRDDGGAARVERP